MSGQEQKDTGKFSGWSIKGDAIGIGDGAKGTVYKTLGKKYCFGCEREVTNQPNGCQCDRKFTIKDGEIRRSKRGSIHYPNCSYCKSNSYDLDNCICLVQQEEVKLTQTKINQKEQQGVSDELVNKNTDLEAKKQSLSLSKEYSRNITNQTQESVDLHQKLTNLKVEELQIQNQEEQKKKEVLIKTKTFLIAKKFFFQARQKTIEELQECFNKLETKIGKHDKIGEIGSTISGVGEVFSTVTFGIPKAIGETIKNSSNFSKLKLSKKTSEEFFQVSLVYEDELTELNKIYDSLISLAYKNKELEISSSIIEILGLESKKILSEGNKLFNKKYKIYDILIGDGIWRGRNLDLEKMERAIISLSQNLEELKTEWEKEVRELQNKFEESILTEKERRLYEKIASKKSELRQLVVSVKTKLKSQSKYSDSKRKERSSGLDSFFKSFPTNPDEIVKGLENIKIGLSKKLTWNEINNLCQTKMELENFQSQEQVVQIQQTTIPYGTPGSSK